MRGRSFKYADREMFELLTLALGRMQDDHALFGELLDRGALDDDRVKHHMDHLAHLSEHARDRLRLMGLTVKPRAPFDEPDRSADTDGL